MKLQRARTEYSVQISDDEMLALIKAEGIVDDLMDPVLSERLDKLPGVDEVEYNGHFGSAVYLRIEAEHDVPATHAAVIKLIREHLAECKEALEAQASPKP